jgi:hypothetical protein
VSVKKDIFRVLHKCHTRDGISKEEISGLSLYISSCRTGLWIVQRIERTTPDERA